jgi:hypothetical protein
MVFHEAHSPGDATFPSMPRLLYQNDLDAVAARGRVGFMRDGEFIPAPSLPSLFSVVGGKQYHTAMVGFQAPYKRWLGDQVDTCRSYLWHQHGYRGLALLAVHAFRATQYWTDPWSTFAYRRWERQLASTSVSNIRRDMKGDVLYFIEDGPRNVFALFHYPLPHRPYLRREEVGHWRTDEWSWRWQTDEWSWRWHNVEGYLNSLVGLDRLIGCFIDAMKRANKFEDALIVMTSDHTWQFDPTRMGGRAGCPKTHVPLLVKLPRQNQHVSVSSLFETARLRPLIARALEPGADVETIVGLLKLTVEDDSDGLAGFPGCNHPGTKPIRLNGSVAVRSENGS